jgi:multisubunit Na+/H+ antiporter MnhE subunit
MLMVFWIWIDDSTDLAELVVGAVVAAVGALVAEVAMNQAGSHLRFRYQWLRPALRLPGEVLRDTGVVFAAMWRTIRTGQQPPSRFEEVRVAWGDESPEGDSRRALLIAGASLAPNTFALGIDREENVMVVHRLVPRVSTEDTLARAGAVTRDPSGGAGRR